MGHPQGLDHLFGVAGLIVLQQCTLQGLALRGLFHEHRLEGVGVEAGVEHTGAHGAGSGVEILHLLRAHVVLIKVLGQIDGILQGAVEYAKELGCAKPEIVLHLDHGDTFETCKSCIDSGFSSVMIDGSHLPYEENVALTKKVVDYAHQFDVTVEGELGVLAGVEDEVSSDHHTYTNPEEVIDFATRTGCDSLAISIGTSHGAYKFTPEQCHIDPATGRMVPPPLAFEVLDAVMEKLPGFPIVLHGSSSVPQEEVETINKYGGALKAAIGIPEEELRKAAKSAVCKINIDSDSRLAMTAAIRQTFAEKPAEFDPRKYLGPARDNMEKLYKHKIINVLGSDNKLAE